ncbi:winged helix-turn-helix domain-containing protein [Serpentinicella alkaliphila]|uniref:Transcriptional regulator n=1 Tax=Serpentinicella alkaliphila TaxID=1734049 RepID=A0A4R2TD48_9FIRM|nr:transcriptional regulator [Serpentinicella alkaliphila]QUH27146.1 transcriptional regulator [Serpentinicella alkaliphila]TCP95038.1 transcriptional regulator [Serpentinicella alkaliphila]
MDINSIPDIFQSKIRIAIVSCLIGGEKSFKELKEVTGATDGNLSVHLSKLSESGYIEILKSFFNKKPQTIYSLTERGKKDFIEYVNSLENLLKKYIDTNT